MINTTWMSQTSFLVHTCKKEKKNTTKKKCKAKNIYNKYEAVRRHSRAFSGGVCFFWWMATEAKQKTSILCKQYKMEPADSYKAASSMFSHSAVAGYFRAVGSMHFNTGTVGSAGWHFLHSPWCFSQTPHTSHYTAWHYTAVVPQYTNHISINLHFHNHHYSRTHCTNVVCVHFKGT